MINKVLFNEQTSICLLIWFLVEKCGVDANTMCLLQMRELKLREAQQRVQGKQHYEKEFICKRWKG